MIPDDLPASATRLVVGIQFDATGEETGIVFSPANVSEGAPVPALDGAPAAILLVVLLGTAVAGLRARGRAKIETY